VFVEAIERDLKSEQGLLELRAIFDFILAQNFHENTENEDVETTAKVCIDILTIVFIHIIVLTN